MVRWVTLLTLSFGSGLDLFVGGIEPRVRIYTVQNLLEVLSPSFSLPLPFSFSRSLSKKKKKIPRKGSHRATKWVTVNSQ